MNPTSIPNPSWSDVRLEFEPDGSWRDIYIFETTRAEWQSLLDWIRAVDPAARFMVDGQAAAIPREVNSIFDNRQSVAPSLHFVHHDVDYGLHFFEDDQIELDIDPREIREDNWPEFIATLSDLSRLVKRDVLVTPENLPGALILRVSASDVRYYPPDRN